MTGGVVVALGSVGRNVGAGMTGGLGYFYDPDNQLDERLNKEIIKAQKIESKEGEAQLKHMIERHFQKTGSEKAEAILNNWDAEVENFVQIYPPSEAKSPFVMTTDSIVTDLRVSASSPDGDMCFLPVGDEQLTPEQTQRCAD
jgi:glutamate synthase (ferredoxin)